LLHRLGHVHLLLLLHHDWLRLHVHLLWLGNDRLRRLRRSCNHCTSGQLPRRLVRDRIVVVRFACRIGDLVPNVGGAMDWLLKRLLSVRVLPSCLLCPFFVPVGSTIGGCCLHPRSSRNRGCAISRRCDVGLLVRRSENFLALLGADRQPIAWAILDWRVQLAVDGLN